ncbi:MAG: DNA mismatch repair endonuclease MutL [Oligoflexales bacterium]|nr:DNA mismatch repair endonuclease MutL [Oligoflexales bacterium]
MGKIQLLSEDLINKIAAGEVIDRPANVVKELCENSLDAGATELIIEIRAGGREGISVKDNGSGIELDDLRLAVQRHATSKITSQNDLFAIHSFGFRGEALASIAAVSRFSIASQTRDSNIGHRLTLNLETAKDSNLGLVQEYSGKSGTTVEVNDLFYNIPARRKFLKSAAAEFGAILELIQALALANPYVAFKLSHNDKVVFFAAAVDRSFSREETLRERLKAILDPSSVEKLCFISLDDPLLKLTALVSPPGLDRASGKDIITFVNQRWIKDKNLRHSVTRAYHSHLLSGRFPLAYIFLDVDPGLIDVNVHPAKTEIKFQYQKETQELLIKAIRSSLRSGAWAAPSLETPSNFAVSTSNLAPEKNYFFDKNFDVDRTYKGSTNLNSNTKFSVFEVNAARGEPGLSAYPALKNPSLLSAAFPFDSATHNKSPQIAWQNLRYIGSFNACYLLFEGDGQLLAVDQHAFHERIIFEQLCNSAQILQQRQKLLIPESFQLDAETLAMFSESRDFLRAHGFDFNCLAPSTLELLAVPSILKAHNFELVIEEIASLLKLQNISEASTAKLAHELLSTIACHSAVRAGEDLSALEVQRLIQQAQEVDFFHNCPHGRRVLKWITQNEVKSWFDRS